VTEVTQETMHLSCAIVETFVESRKFSPPHVYLWPVLGVGISPRSLAPENCCPWLSSALFVWQNL